MSIFIVDASVAFKWFFDEPHTKAARRILDERNRLHAPDFLLLEFDNILCTRIRRGEISDREGGEVRAVFRLLPVQMHPSTPLLDLAFRMAVETQRSLYDCLYLALAVLLDGRMITADRRFYDALTGSPFGDLVAWVEERASETR